MKAALLAGVASICFGIAGLAIAQRAQAFEPQAMGEIAVAQLPKEARDTLRLIRKGGPFPYAKDGVTFGNREAQLPKQRRGYYHEFTVKTPGERTRGARRIVKGNGGEFYFSDDHYNSFKRILE
jgi:ribonuclease T1